MANIGRRRTIKPTSAMTNAASTQMIMTALGVVATPDCSISFASDELAPPSALSIAGAVPLLSR